MKLHFLGTGASYPTTRRGVSATAVQLDDGSVWLFDCGEGTQIQAQKVAISRQKINKIFITHLHGDHLFGLPGLLCTISSQIGLTQEELQKRGIPVVDIYGPVGLQKFIYTSLSLSRSPLVFQYRVHELVPVAAQYPEGWDEWEVDHYSTNSSTHPSQLLARTIHPTTDDEGNVHWKLIDDERWKVVGGWIHHRVPSFGYVIKEKDRPGTLDTEKLLSLGLKPGPLYGQLKAGKSITTDDGQTITPDMVLGPPIAGKGVAILGDTSDASPILHCARGCDVVVHEATHDDSLQDKAQEFGHSTPSQAVAFATDVGATVLLLNHFSQRYSPICSEVLKDDEETVAVLENQAIEAARGTPVSVQCVDDLFVYELPATSRIMK